MNEANTLEQEPVVETLKALVSIDSTSHRTNLPMVEALEARLAATGCALRRQSWRDERGTEKVNLIATLGDSSSRPALALVGHTDCVPFDPAWGDALRPTVTDGRLYGRGACDTKGFIAAALSATLAVTTNRDLGRPLALVFTADEEVGCLGAKRLVDERLGGAERAVVGEPTSLQPIRANKGYCVAEVVVTGKEAHSAYPQDGASAIFRAARVLARLEDAASGAVRVERDDAFEPPFTTVNVGVVGGGTAKNVIPGRCRFTVEWRPIPGQPVERVAELLEEAARELTGPGSSDGGAEVQVTVDRQRLDRGFDTAPDAELVRFLEARSGKAAGTVAFGTEAPQMTALGAESVVIGPGSIRVAHQTGEYVPLDELVACQRLLEATIREFCEVR